MTCWLQVLVLVAWAGLAALGRAQAAQRPECPGDKPQCRAQDGDGLNEYPFIIDGVKLLLEFTDGGYYLFKCSGNLTLDNTALPRFKSPLRFKNIVIAYCPPPHVSYANVFDKLNVRALDKIQLYHAGNLTAAHLTGLRDVLALELVAAELAPGALDALPQLRRLGLDRVHLPPAALLRLPRGLQALQLRRMYADVTRDVLDTLPSLVNVTVSDPRDVTSVKQLLEFTDGDCYIFNCSGNLTLDNAAQPRFKSPLRFKNIVIADCPPPRVSYANVFDKVNVRALDKIKLYHAGNLTAAHLTGLRDVLALELVAAELAPGALDALPQLRCLGLDRVRLPQGTLLRLPRGLQALQLRHMGADVTRDVLDTLPSLVNVTVSDSRDVTVALGSGLRVLELETPALRVPSTLTPALRVLTMYYWAEARPAPWASCALESLTVRFATTEELPPGWVSACADLHVLFVLDAPKLRSLHETSLRGARHLRELTLSLTGLTELPPGLLDDAEKLNMLDLSGNRLEALPGGLFVRTRYLQTLNLSNNRLTTDVYWSLSAVTSLAVLDLSSNDLKDSCGGANDTVRGSSPLKELKQLTELRLRNTSASLMCRDWRETMPLLKKLNLASNRFTVVTYTDLQFPVSVEVDLSGNDIRTLEYRRADYERVVGGATSLADVRLGGALGCDCGAYWAVRALRDRPAHVRLLHAECARGGRLAEQQPARLLCAAAPRCTCAWRPGEHARVLRVSCERADLMRVRDALAPLEAGVRRGGATPNDYEWQLHLAHNRIADLDAADLPKNLSVLDLTNNSLSLLSEEDARALLVDGRRVLLAGNPLRCDCAAERALAALQARPAGLADYDAITCSSGERLAGVGVRACGALGGGAVAALVALAALLVAAALGAALAPRVLRLRIKAALHARGWLPAPREPDDCRFDVFVSFSHGDERFVRDELVARLESGTAPYRLCVHYRDWAPGGWIPAQIAASVRASRRTVAVVSEHFLRSAWARAEFQEAYALALRDARPRLVVVLLDEPAALPLDDKLRRYLATNTYVRWGDPWFWEKLRLALPRGRGPEPASTCA